MIALFSAQVPYGKYWVLRGVRGLLSFPFPSFPARCRFSLSPGLPPRHLYGQSSTKEASVEESSGDCAIELNHDLRSEWAKRWLVTMNELRLK